MIIFIRIYVKIIGRFIKLIGQMMIILFFLPSTISFSQDLSQLYISEFMADNSTTLSDEDGDYSDWIELHNPASEAIDLSGWYLSDNPDNLIKWIFPQVTIEGNGFIIIFASGKDRHTGELHTNFQLSSSGEWVVLSVPDGITKQFDIQFPVQYSNVSYGYIDESVSYIDDPTPGAINTTSTFLSQPTFSFAHGFYDTSFNLEIYSDVDGGTIIYTRDGSDPNLDNGLIYSEAIGIDSTSVVRAAVEKEGLLSRIATNTYIFPGKVKNQPYRPEGYPGNWGSFSTIAGIAPAHYMMDPEICQSPDYKDDLVPALKSIPTISLSTNKDNFFSFSSDPNTGGIYIHTDPPTGGLGEDWERPVSMEYVLADGRFQVDCGIRIHGGHSRVPEKNPKHSFRLVFRNEYGPKKLNYRLFGEGATSSYNTIILRAGFNQSWLHWDDTQRERTQYINDSWAKDVFMKMGYPAAHNKFVHLYINGLYWGLYNMCERMDDDFMDYYLDGAKEDFDVIKDYAEVAEGNADAWNTMMEMAEEGLSGAASFYGIQGKNEFGDDDPLKESFLDIENLIDYMLLNFYGGNLDWDHHNWLTARNRFNPGNGFQFFPWDTERIFNNKSDNVVNENNENRPSYLYSQLRHNPVFRIQFAKRANELLGPGGMLSPDSVMAVWQKRSKEIELAIIAESARWGDFRRDVHPYKNEPYELYTKNDHWLKEQQRLTEDYFPERSQIVLDQLKAIGLAGEVITETHNEIGQISASTHKSFPNPFYTKVTVQFISQSPSNIKVDVLNMEGQILENLFDGFFKEQYLELTWKPKKQNSGLYFYRIVTNDNVFTGKMIYVK